MIQITDRFYIDADTNCYSLKEKTIVQDKTSKNYAKEQYKDLGYYSTLEGCLEGIIKTTAREFIGEKQINSIEELRQVVKCQTEVIQSLNLKF